MWGRVLEVAIAVWLALSPFIFRAQESATLVWIDCFTALAIAVLAALSYWPPTRYAHLLTLVIALALVVFGRFVEIPPPPEQQNHIVIGLLLLMISLIPNHASIPPMPWRDPVGHESNDR